MRSLRDLFQVLGRSLLGAVCGVGLLASQGFAGSVSLSSLDIAGQGQVGSFTGHVAYDNVSHLLSITLTNTTDSADGGFITAFVFNVEGNSTARLSPNPTGLFYDVIGGDVYLAKAAPFGDFEAGAGLATSDKAQSNKASKKLNEVQDPILGEFDGSGKPQDGIAPGQSQLFQFLVSGSDAGALSASSFLSQYSGQGSNSASFLVRIRGLNEPNDFGVGSEKIPDDVLPPLVPLPQAAWSGLMLMGLIGIQGIRRQLRRVA